MRTSGCHGFCERGPLVVIHPQRIFYQRVKLDDAAEIIAKTVLKDEIIDRLVYRDPVTKEKILYEHDVPFYKKQTRLIFGHERRRSTRRASTIISRSAATPPSRRRSRE